jgi:hypothetical protein
MDKNNGPATFTWRITHGEHRDNFTLLGWSNVKKEEALPLEYLNHCGATFWAVDDDHIALRHCDISSCFAGYGKVNAATHLRTRLKRGNKTEKDEYNIIINHLKTAGENLRITNGAIGENSEIVTIEV